MSMNCFQKHVFDLIVWFHGFCEQNNLTYFMLGGTMLGAIRHHGFIPWDDDADFGMPRKDYERFKELTNNVKHDLVAVESYSNKKSDFSYPFIKIYDKSTTLVENLRYPVKRGVYIDIFPLDSCGSRDSFSVNHFFFQINTYNLKVCKRKNTRTPLKRFVLFVFQLVFRKKPNYYKNCQKLDKKAMSFNSKDGNNYANFFGAWQKKEIIPKEMFDTPSKYIFEGLLLNGPKDFDGYLSLLYGDYKKLPPVEKRGNHHDFIELDLNKGFLDK